MRVVAIGMLIIVAVMILILCINGISSNKRWMGILSISLVAISIGMVGLSLSQERTVNILHGQNSANFNRIEYFSDLPYIEESRKILYEEKLTILKDYLSFVDKVVAGKISSEETAGQEIDKINPLSHPATIRNMPVQIESFIMPGEIALGTEDCSMILSIRSVACREDGSVIYSYYDEYLFVLEKESTIWNAVKIFSVQGP